VRSHYTWTHTSSSAASLITHTRTLRTLFPTGGGGASWGRSAAGASSSGGGGDPFDFDFGSYGRSSGGKRSGGGAPAEDFYGLGDFFRDLDKELSEFEARGSQRAAAA
jgi:hypothetical protein